MNHIDTHTDTVRMNNTHTNNSLTNSHPLNHMNHTQTLVSQPLVLASQTHHSQSLCSQPVVSQNVVSRPGVSQTGVSRPVASCSTNAQQTNSLCKQSTGLFINTKLHSNTTNFTANRTGGTIFSPKYSTTTAAMPATTLNETAINNFFDPPSETRSIEALFAARCVEKKAEDKKSINEKIQMNQDSEYHIMRELDAILADNQALTTTTFAQINARLDRGFFMNENQEWTSYRRNYFKVSVGFTLHSSNSNNNSALPLDKSTSLYLGKDNQEFKNFEIGLVGKTSDCDKPVELIQHTPKRDKNSVYPVKFLTIAPGGNPFSCLQNGNTLSSSSDTTTCQSYTTRSSTSMTVPTIVTFDRVQFKKATANNGKRKAAQQFYSLGVELYGITQNDERVLLAVISSAPLVIRGRSPGHYTSKNLQLHIDGNAPLSAGLSSASTIPESPFSHLLHSADHSSILLSPQRALFENGLSSFSLSCTNNSPIHHSASSTSFTSSTTRFHSNHSSPNTVSPHPFPSNSSYLGVAGKEKNMVASWIPLDQSPQSFLQQDIDYQPTQPHSFQVQQQQHQQHPQQQQHQQYQQQQQSPTGFSVGYNHVLHQPQQHSFQMEQQPFPLTNILFHPQIHNDDLSHEKNTNLVLTSPFPLPTPTYVDFPTPRFLPETATFYHAISSQSQPKQQSQQQYLTSPPSSFQFHEDQFSQQIEMSILATKKE